MIVFVNEFVFQKDKVVINMGDFSFIYVQFEFQIVFEYILIFFFDGFYLCFGVFDDEDKIIGIAVVCYCGFLLLVFFDCCILVLLDIVILVLLIFFGFFVQVVFMQVLIEFIQYDV